MTGEVAAEIRERGCALLPDRAPAEVVAALREALDRMYLDERNVPRQAAEPGCLRGYNLVRRAPIFRQALVHPPGEDGLRHCSGRSKRLVEL